MKIWIEKIGLSVRNSHTSIHWFSAKSNQTVTLIQTDLKDGEIKFLCTVFENTLQNKVIIQFKIY